jgi:hypothetical protein
MNWFRKVFECEDKKININYQIVIIIFKCVTIIIKVN